jgi:hypothetical protein
MKSIQQEIISYMPYLNRAVLQMPVYFYTPKEECVPKLLWLLWNRWREFLCLASIVMQMFEQGENSSHPFISAFHHALYLYTYVHL